MGYLCRHNKSECTNNTLGCPGLRQSRNKKNINSNCESYLYSHFMESQYEGTFQKDMDIILKKNHLHPVKFPDLIRTEGIKESTHAEMEDPFTSTEEILRKEPSVRRREKEIDKACQEPMETGGATHKRMRELTTPSPQEEKDKEKR